MLEHPEIEIDGLVAYAREGIVISINTRAVWRVSLDFTA